MDTFDGRGAVVTGGASGIGLATAREFAARGAAAAARDCLQGVDIASVAAIRPQHRRHDNLGAINAISTPTSLHGGLGRGLG